MEKLKMNSFNSLKMKSSNSLPFPDDLMVEIFIRLPMKPLFRCKCVSKQWRALISSHPSLVLCNTTGFYIMVNSTKASQPGNIKFINVHPNSFIMDDSSSSSSDPVVIDMNLNFIQQSFIIIDSNNGYLLIQGFEEKKISTSNDEQQPSQYFVCNPFTKKLISLPEPKYQYDREKTSLLCYKDDNDDEHGIEFEVTCCNRFRSEIYSSKTKLWIESDDFRRDGRGIFFNECVYWLEEQNHSNVLFSSKNSRGFRGIKFPCAKQSTYYEQLLGVCGSSLYFADSNESRFMVWRLVNGVDWCMKHHITFKTVIYPEVYWITAKHPFIPLAFHPLNYQIVLVVMNNRLVIYRMDEKRIELVNELQDEFFEKRIELVNELQDEFFGNTYNLLNKKYFPNIRNLSVFPFSFAAWSTCNPCIEDT